MAEDDTTSDSGGFDDWLDEKPGPPTDPYASLQDDDPEEEIADWVAFTQGRDGTDADSGSETLAEDDLTQLPTEEMDISDLPVAPYTALHDEGDETSEIPVDEAADNGDSGLHPDDLTEELEPFVEAQETVESDDGATDELPMIVSPDDDEVVTDELPTVPSPVDDVAHALEASDTDPDVIDVGGGDDEEPDDTGELDVVPIAPYGGFSQAPPGEPPGTDESTGFDDVPPAVVVGTVAGATTPRPELFDMSEGDYLGTATREHTDLAEAIALAEEENTAQVAVSAPIPGLADTVVGFEDVVEAEGMRKARSRRSGDLVARVLTALVLIVAFGASLVWQPVLVAFATAVFVLGAGEFYTSLVRSGRKPIAFFGFIGIIGATLGAYFWGVIAIPTAFFIAGTLLLLFYAVVPGKKDPMANLALTITVMVWAGLGAFAMPIIAAASYRELVIGVVITVAAMDIAQYFFGRMLGRTQLSPWVSPKKTVEGLIAGVIVALVVGAGLSFIEPFDLTTGMLLGVVVAVLSPLGDLAMSAAKRSLGIKDMGSVLPGHGGFLDRIDGLLFAIPAAWAVFLWAGLL